MLPVSTFEAKGSVSYGDYAYANASFEWVRKHGGKTFLDGGNSHPANFWEILIEERRTAIRNEETIAS